MPFAYGPRALRVTVALLLLTGVVFALFPRLDLNTADYFEDMMPAWAIGKEHWAKSLRQVGLWLPVVFGLAMVAVLLIRSTGRRIADSIASRDLVTIILLLLLGPGLLVNVGLKDHWGRPRPPQALAAWEAKDHKVFKPWWDPRGICDTNCSFVSGEVSGAETLVAAAAVLPTASVAVPVAFAFTVLVALLRVAFGGHFPSDVLFAGLLTHLLGIGLFALMRFGDRLRPALRVRPRFL